MRESTPRILTGTFPFTGAGFGSPQPLAVTDTVPADRRAQMIYFRAGQSADALVSVVLSRNGEVMRLFPIGAKGAIHVPLAVVEDLEPETALTVGVAAAEGTTGTVVLDVGLVEI